MKAAIHEGSSMKETIRRLKRVASVNITQIRKMTQISQNG